MKAPNHLALGGGKGANGVWVSPAPELVQGHIRDQCEKLPVEFVKLLGYWYLKRGEAFDAEFKPTKAEKVVYTLHGTLQYRPDPSAHLRMLILLQGVDSLDSQHILQIRWLESHMESSLNPKAFIRFSASNTVSRSGT